MDTGLLNGSSLCVFIIVRPWIQTAPSSCSPAKLLTACIDRCCGAGDDGWGMGGRWAATLTPCCLLQVWWVRRSVLQPLLCCTLLLYHLFQLEKKEEEDGCSVLHALADLHNAIPQPQPPPRTPHNKSGLWRIAAHTASETCIVAGLFRS